MKRLNGLHVAVGVLSMSFALGSVVEAQKPIRVGASLSQTGAYAALGQNQQRGYQLCVKHTNEKGGVLGRRLELVLYDDWSDPATAVRLYEKLVTQDAMDLLLGPYGSPITDAVADVAEKYKQPLVTLAASTSIFRKGRKFVFMLFPPAEIYLEGLFDIAVKRGLKTVAILHEDTLFAKAVADDAADLAKKRVLEVVGVHGCPKGNVDFSTILDKVRGVNPDVLSAATYFDDAVAITRQLKQSNVNPRMYAVTVAGDLPKSYEILGKDAEFVYGPSLWDPELVTLRAGGLIPHRPPVPGGAGVRRISQEGVPSCRPLLPDRRWLRDLPDPRRGRQARRRRGWRADQGSHSEDGPEHSLRALQGGPGRLPDRPQDVVVPVAEQPEGDPVAGAAGASKPRFPTPPWNQRP